MRYCLYILTARRKENQLCKIQLKILLIEKIGLVRKCRRLFKLIEFAPNMHKIDKNINKYLTAKNLMKF